MTTYGPFYPTTVTTFADGGSPWTHPENAAGTPDGDAATVTVPPDEASDFLLATGFVPLLPAGVTVTGVTFQFQGLNAALSQGWNVSDARLATSGVPGPDDNYSSNGQELSWEVTAVPEGVALKMYTAGTSVPAAVEAIALFVDVA